MSLQKSRLSNSFLVAMFVLPALIPLFVFWIYPILRTVWLSFTDWNFMSPDYQIVLCDNYKSLLTDSRFYNALVNTLVFTLGDTWSNHYWRFDISTLTSKEDCR